MITHAMLLLALVAPGTPGDRLADAVTVEHVFGHLRALQAIADAHGGNRAAGLPGYDASAAYVASKLRDAGYTVELQPFAFNFYRELAPALVRGSHAYSDARTMEFSAAGDVTARPQQAGSGCTASEFATFVTGRIALVKRGGCLFEEKAKAAATAGARALVVIDPSATFDGSVRVPQPLPVVAVGPVTGKELGERKRIRVMTRTESEMRITHNVIAQTTGKGNPFMVGAHLDSRQEGPGINDNGSGSAAVLEVALRAARLHPRRPVRFAWWGGEELGLLGSQHYVSSLTPAERKKIRFYLNLDMIASPNYKYQIYDGDNSDSLGGGPFPMGSAGVERTLQQYFTGRGLPYTGKAFDGRSDYGPFITAGIPAGGLSTGAEQLKTADEATRFGGAADQPLDGCYHQACDSLGNVDRKALAVNTGALANFVSHYAWPKS
ncbi:M28 family metallopeptidase [Nonomuraea sp. NPDC050536]|uniref:M28 family metallopeptidase n=1 Tax=Nonomuraea sp. NPDC050536 TaxID=3364366 RepID=UPI0037CB355A